MATCLLCEDDIQVPVRPLFTCFESPENHFNYFKCRGRMCLVCLRGYLKLNLPRNNRADVKCPVCLKTEIKSQTLKAKTAYVIDETLMDNMNGTVKCRQCYQEMDSQRELWKHLRGDLPENSCPESYTICIDCRQTMKRKCFSKHLCLEESVGCMACSQTVLQKNLNDHGCPEEHIFCSSCDQPMLRKEIITHNCSYSGILLSMKIKDIKYEKNTEIKGENYEGYRITTESNHDIFVGVNNHADSPCEVFGVDDEIVMEDQGDINSDEIVMENFLKGKIIQSIKWESETGMNEQTWIAVVRIQFDQMILRLTAWASHNGYYPHTAILKYLNQVDYQEL